MLDLKYAFYVGDVHTSYALFSHSDIDFHSQSIVPPVAVKEWMQHYESLRCLPDFHNHIYVEVKSQVYDSDYFQTAVEMRPKLCSI